MNNALNRYEIFFVKWIKLVPMFCELTIFVSLET